MILSTKELNKLIKGKNYNELGFIITSAVNELLYVNNIAYTLSDIQLKKLIEKRKELWEMTYLKTL